MTVNNNITPFPFYTDIDEQNGRKPWAYGVEYPFFVPMTTLMPFQFARTTRSNGIRYVRLYRVDGTLIATITSQMLAAGLHITRFQSAGYDVISFPAIVPVNLDLQLGRYYIAISDGVQVFYSEVFTATTQMGNYLKIEWWDKSNLYYAGGLIQYEDSRYPNRYKNTIYVCSNLGMPDYENEEEGEERDGIFFPNHQISYKVYRFRFLAPEFLTDALRVAWLSDYVRVTDPLGRVYNCNTFVPTVEWQDEGYLANVEVEFRTDTVVKKTGLGYIPEGGTCGDFNNDYSEDFDNQECTGGDSNIGLVLDASNIDFGEEGGTAELVIQVKNQTTNWLITKSD